jgi:hypothetical protein
MPLFAERGSTRDAEAVDRVRQLAELYRKYELTQMPVEQVLDVLNPAGSWRTTPVQIGGKPDAKADPVTGCLPVTPQ